METASDHAKRYQRQLEVLRSWKRGPLDIFCLQEVNPLPNRLDEIQAALDCNAGSCTVNAGVKIGNLGIPPGLREGLAILINNGFENRTFRELTLSGDALEYAQLVFQTKERRKALLFEGTFGGVRMGVINLHLHHGPDTDPKNLERKKSELQKLMAWIEQRMKSWDITAVCGDFNCAGSSPCLEPLLSLGFQDSANLADIEALPTWDPSINSLAHQSSVLADSPETEKWDATPQVLDRIYLKTKTNLSGVSLTQIREPELSDHFGLCVEMTY